MSSSDSKMDEERKRAAAKFRARMVADIRSAEPEPIEGRFKDWTKDEMVLHLVQKGVVIRNEHQISYKIVRDLMKSYYDGLDDPSKPINRYNELTRTVVDRGVLMFQDLFFRYLYKVRLYAGVESAEIDMKRNNEREFGDAYGGVTTLSSEEKEYRNSKQGRRNSLGRRAAEMEAAAAAKMTPEERAAMKIGRKALSAFSDALGMKYRGVRSVSDAAVLGGADSYREDKHDFHSTLLQVAEESTGSKGGISKELKESEHGQRVFSYLDAPFAPPNWEGALEHAESLRPRRWVHLPDKPHDEHEPFDFYRTTTGRHCMSGGMGEQCDILHEGKYSELSPLGPSVTNFFKFVKWLIWVFMLLTVVSLIMTIINVYGPRSPMNTYDMRLSDITMTTIGNLVYGLTGRNPDSFMIYVPGCYEGAFTAVRCTMDQSAVGWVYASTDWAVVIIFIIALVWLKKYERKEEVLLDSRLITVAMYSVMVKNLPAKTSEDDLKRYIEEVCELKGLGDPAIENVTLGLDKFKSDEEDEDEEGLKKLYKLEHDVERAVSQKKTAAGAGSDDGDNDDNDDLDNVEKGAAAGATSPAGDRKGLYRTIFGPKKKYSIKDVIKRGKLVEERKRLVQKHRFDVTRLRTGNYARGTGPRAVSKADIEEKVAALRETFFQDVVAINKEIADHDGCLSILQKRADHAQVAFVTFESVEMAERVKEVFEAGYMETLGGWVGIKAKNEREDDIYPIWRGKRLRIVPAPDPEDVIWENLNVEWWPRMRGRLITLVFGLLLCIVSLVVLVTGKDQLEKAYSEGKADATAGAETLAFFLACIISFNNFVYEQLVQWFANHFEKHHSRETMEQSVFTRLLFFRLVNTTLIFLVCNNAFFQLMEPPFSPDVQDDDNSPLAMYIVRNAHNPSVVDFDYSWYSSVGLMLMLVQMVSVITSQIGLYMQWKAYQNQLQSVRSHCKVHENIWSAAVDLKASEDDTVAGGGASVRTSDVEMASVSSRGTTGSSFTFFGGRQKTLDGLYQSIVLSRSLEQEENRILLTQKEVNDKVAGPTFDWPVVYAQFISTIFVTLTFGTGIPMLYPFALIKFIVSYFSYKFFFLRLYRAPPRNRSSKLSREATALIPLALTMHVIMSIWMLTYGDLFNSDATSARDNDSRKYLTQDQLRDRLLNGHTLASVIFGCALLLVCGAGFLYGRNRLDKNNIYSYLFTIPCTGVCGSGTITSPTVPGSLALDMNFARAVMRNLIKGPNNYSILSNSLYTDKLGVGYDFAARHGHLHAKSYSDMARSGKSLPPRDASSKHKSEDQGDYSVKRSAPEHILHYELGQRLRSMAARKFRPIKMGEDPHKNDISQEELLEVVNLVYEQYNPSKLPEVPELVGKFAGREHTMCASLVRKYHIGMDAFETQIYAIYERFNPDKTPDVEGILVKYRGVEKKLFEGLRVKYRINMHPVENEMWTIIDEYDTKRRDEIVHMLNDAGGPHTQRAASLLQQIRDMYNKGSPMPLKVKANAEHFKYEHYNPFPRSHENIPLVPHSTNYRSSDYSRGEGGGVPAKDATASSPRQRVAPNTKSVVNGYTPVSLVTLAPQEGKFILENGHLYVGRLKGRLPDGEGRINDPHSTLELEGTFVAGKLKGKGRLLTVGGNLYEGDFDDLFHGHGVYKWKDGSLYEGSFVRGKKEGAGRYTGPSGNTYEGSFVNDEFDGFGIYTNASNGVVYEGYFSRGRKHGAGQLFSKDGRSRNGVWSEGKEVKGTRLTEDQVNDVKKNSDAAYKSKGDAPRDPAVFVPSSKGDPAPAAKPKPKPKPKPDGPPVAGGKGQGGSFKASSAEDNAKDAESWSETVTFEASPGGASGDVKGGKKGSKKGGKK